MWERFLPSLLRRERGRSLSHHVITYCFEKRTKLGLNPEPKRYHSYRSERSRAILSHEDKSPTPKSDNLASDAAMNTETRVLGSI